MSHLKAVKFADACSILFQHPTLIISTHRDRPLFADTHKISDCSTKTVRLFAVYLGGPTGLGFGCIGVCVCVSVQFAHDI